MFKLLVFKSAYSPQIIISCIQVIPIVIVI